MIETAIGMTTLTQGEARQQIQRIKSHWQAFWFELKDFHDQKGWLPLGYTSFKACVEQELGISEQRAYQLLDAAAIRAELDTQPGLSVEGATERQLRELKPLDPEQRLEIAREVDFANTTVLELRHIVKGSPHVSFNGGNNEWYTPAEYIEAARRVMRAIDLDPASSRAANEIVKAVHYHTEEDDGLLYPWAGRVWMNPPYAAELIGRFAEKLVRHFEEREVSQAIVLVNNATETRWFQRLLMAASVVCFPMQRVRFLDTNGEPGAPLQGQAVLYLGEHHNPFAREFEGFGTILYGR